MGEWVAAKIRRGYYYSGIIWWSRETVVLEIRDKVAGGFQSFCIAKRLCLNVVEVEEMY